MKHEGGIERNPVSVFRFILYPLSFPTMTWTQNYDPFASGILSPLVAALPIVLLLGLLASGRVSAPLAALAGLLAALLTAIFAFVPPEASTPDGPGQLGWARTMLTTAGYGAAFGL